MSLRLPFLLFFVAAFSAQAQRIVVIPSPNKAAAPVNEQVYSLLCEQTTAECVDAKAVMTQKKLDWNKVKKRRIRWIVTVQYKATAAQQGKPAQRKATVSAQNASTRKVQLKPTYPLTSSRTLSRQNEAKLSQTFSKTLRLQPAFPSEESTDFVAQTPFTPPSDSGAQTLDLGLEETTPPEETLALEENWFPEETAEPVLPPTAPPAKATTRAYPIATIEVGMQLFNHKHEFAKLKTNNLRSFEASLQAAPTLRAEFYPLAFMDLGLASGIGLDASFAMSLGFKIQDENNNKFPMNWSTVDGGLRWRMQFSKTWRGALTPMVGIQHVSLSHGTLADGTKLNGFPKLSMTALRVGLGFELPFASDWLVAFGDFSYLPVLSAKELLAAPYFPEGSAFGLAGKLGLGVKIWGPLSVRLSGFLSRTNFTLKAASDSPYVADSATYQRLGGQVGLAASF